MNIKNKSLIFIITAIPFYLNDFSNIFINAELPWLLIDYSLKLIPLCLIFYMIVKKNLSLKDLGLTALSPIKFILWTIGITLLGLCLDEPGFAIWSKILPSFKLGTIPIGPGSPLYTLDMTVGLMLVAIAEEIIFRGLAFTMLKEKGFSPAAIFIISGIAFGLIHWSAGPVAVVATALTGTGLMICMWKTKSILPTIVAHYIINYLSFSGLASNLWGI
ncbi:CPBP family intramembrane glutamic endopeptidase [Maridesulfovibrio ferrireducens]|uniref:CPBP family intramembrane glutamic endopeptidase n=1 Tax=Maridesulfovibrio ferrireducens TaxID=246191 RepID=UPI001A1C5C20|nr:CPBP family intramembrane glutamic endopeptidase [Maridesulfovibrio ferrireducens]MBI9111704.1 CPBP family intramembrane metalloprotease [Maridesulfovibrio ferrireducens]